MSASSDRSVLVTCKRDPWAHEKDRHSDVVGFGHPQYEHLNCIDPVLAIWSGPRPTPDPKPTTETHPILYRGLVESAKLLGRELACESGVMLCRPECPRFRTLQKSYEFDREMAVLFWRFRFSRIRNWLGRR